jgi:hypothetical protein
LLDRPDERPAAVAALRVGAAVAADPFEASRFRLEAGDASTQACPAGATSRSVTIAAIAYSALVGAVAIGGAVAEITRS